MVSTILLGVIGPWQIALIALLIVVFFGGKRIPELMKGLGGGVREFKKALKDEDGNEADKSIDKGTNPS
ncbi:twin-arginine translocase TatA/TatE family subunit [bacterium]|nr:twin-arginine translocase TatA/TatE family subunit [bacterium]